MKFYLKLGFILLAFCVVATAILAYVNSVTKPRIDELKRVAAQEAMAKLIPNAEFSDVVIHLPEGESTPDSLVYYIATAKGDSTKILGYIFTAEKHGYSSNVKTMAAIDTEFKLINIKVIEQAETPGLGANCSSESFAERFKGLLPEKLLVDKDGGEVKAMTGATITTRAVTNSIRETIAIVRKDIESRANTLPEVEA